MDGSASQKLLSSTEDPVFYDPHNEEIFADLEQNLYRDLENAIEDQDARTANTATVAAPNEPSIFRYLRTKPVWSLSLEIASKRILNAYQNQTAHKSVLIIVPRVVQKSYGAGNFTLIGREEVLVSAAKHRITRPQMGRRLLCNDNGTSGSIANETDSSQDPRSQERTGTNQCASTLIPAL